MGVCLLAGEDGDGMNAGDAYTEGCSGRPSFVLNTLKWPLVMEYTLLLVYDHWGLDGSASVYQPSFSVSWHAVLVICDGQTLTGT